MNPHAAAFLAKARRSLASARTMVETGDAEGAINRAYYAVFYAATAALLSAGETIKTHSGVHNRFRVRFVHTGRIPDEIGKILPFAFQLRQQADYDAVTRFDLRAVSDLIEDAARFIPVLR